MGQLVNITNKMPTLNNTKKLVCTPHKVVQLKGNAGFATENTTPIEQWRKRLMRGKKFSQKSSFTTNQPFELVPYDDEELPKFKPAPESLI